MAEKRYTLRLWRERSGSVLPRVLAPKLVAGDTTDWLDLEDRPATAAKLARLVAAHGNGPGEYWLEVADPVTGERIARIEADQHDPRLAAGVNGYPALSLEDVSDETLLRELARRLRER